MSDRLRDLWEPERRAAADKQSPTGFKAACSRQSSEKNQDSAEPAGDIHYRKIAEGLAGPQRGKSRD
jgi:hypothetical protein